MRYGVWLDDGVTVEARDADEAAAKAPAAVIAFLTGDGLADFTVEEVMTDA